MPHNALLYALNRWSDSTLGSISSSGETTGHLASYTQEGARNRTWRSPGISGLFLSRDLGAAFKIGGLAIVFPKQIIGADQRLGTTDTNSSMTTAGTLRVRCSNNADLSFPVYDSGTIAAWEQIYTSVELGTGTIAEWFTDGLPQVATLPQLQGLVRRILLPAEVSARYIRVDFTDPANPLGYLDVSYVYAGRVLEISPNILYGWRVWRDEVARDPQAASGQLWPARVFRRTRVTATLPLQAQSDVTGTWLLLLSLLGTHKEVIVSVVDRVGSIAFYTSLFGRFSASPKAQNVAFQRFTWPVEIEEIVS